MNRLFITLFNAFAIHRLHCGLHFPPRSPSSASAFGDQGPAIAVALSPCIPRIDWHMPPRKRKSSADLGSIREISAPVAKSLRVGTRGEIQELTKYERRQPATTSAPPVSNVPQAQSEAEESGSRHSAPRKVGFLLLDWLEDAAHDMPLRLRLRSRRNFSLNGRKPV